MINVTNVLDESPGSSPGPTSPVLTAAAPCPPAETVNDVTAPIVAGLKPTTNGNGNGQKPLTFASSERQRLCEQCGKWFIVKRPKNFKPKRFCSNQCKRRYFYVKNGR